jgi:hypothetical protein
MDFSMCFLSLSLILRPILGLANAFSNAAIQKAVYRWAIKSHYKMEMAKSQQNRKKIAFLKITAKFLEKRCINVSREFYFPSLH